MARIILRQRYADFPDDIELGHFVINCEKRVPSFQIGYGNDLGKRYWSIKIDREGNVEETATGILTCGFGEPINLKLK